MSHAAFRRDLPAFHCLSEFLDYLAGRGDLLRIGQPVSTVLEATEIHRQAIAQQGPVLRFEQPVCANGDRASIPLIANLFGTPERVAAGLGTVPGKLPALGELLAALREPSPPRGLRDVMARWGELRAILNARPHIVRRAPAQQHVRVGGSIDLGMLPIQTCWPDEPAPLITWPVVITRPPDEDGVRAFNLGIYRMQVISRQSAIVRWLPRRGGSEHHRLWRAAGKPMPIAVAIGVDPALLLAAATPVPENVCEYDFAGALRGARTALIPARTVPLLVPAEAEIVLEGFVDPEETAPEGPYGDHTGYYNAVERFPVMRIGAMTHRDAPLYLSTFTGRAPDEPSVIAETLLHIFLPLLRKALPEVVDCWMPPEACSYRIAVLSIRKSYAGQARRVMMGFWSLLPQFAMTKMVLVVDDDIDVRTWPDVLWAMATRMDPGRDLVVVRDTPMDPLDFASPEPGLAGKVGIDATTKTGPETAREWGRPLKMPDSLIEAVQLKFGGVLSSKGSRPGVR